MLSGLGASIAGIMISSVRFGGDPVAGQVYVLKSIAAVVVGGTALTGGKAVMTHLGPNGPGRT